MAKTVYFNIEIRGTEKEIQRVGMLEKQLAKLKNQRAELNRKLKDGERLTQEETRELGRLNSSIKNLQSSRSKTLQQLQRQYQANTSVKGSMAALRAETNAMIARTNNLNLTNAKGRAEFQRLRTQIQRNQAQIKQFDESMGRFQGNVGNYAGGIKTAFQGMAGAFTKALVVFGAIRGASRIFTTILKKADEQERQVRALNVALKGNEDIQKRLISLAQERQKVTRFGDEETIQAEVMLAKILGDNEDAITQLIPLIQDLATVQGMDLKSAADLVGKSVGSSTNALSRYGIVIEGDVGSAERLESAVKALNEQVGGQAVAAAEVGMGAWIQLGNSWGDYQESLGTASGGASYTVANIFKTIVDHLNEGAAAAEVARQNVVLFDQKLKEVNENQDRLFGLDNAGFAQGAYYDLIGKKMLQNRKAAEMVNYQLEEEAIVTEELTKKVKELTIGFDEQITVSERLYQNSETGDLAISKTSGVISDQTIKIVALYNELTRLNILKKDMTKDGLQRFIDKLNELRNKSKGLNNETQLQVETLETLNENIKFAKEAQAGLNINSKEGRLEFQRLNKVIKENEDRLKSLTGTQEKAKGAYQTLTSEVSNLSEQLKNQLTLGDQDGATATGERLLEIQTRLKGINDEFARLSEAAPNFEPIFNALDEGLSFKEDILLTPDEEQSIIEDADFLAEQYAKTTEGKIAANQHLYDQDLISQAQYNVEKEALERELLSKEIAIQKLKEKAKISIALNTFSVIKSLSQEGSAFFKAAAIGEALVNAYLAGSGAYESAMNSDIPYPLNFILAFTSGAVALAEGFAAVNSIKQVKMATGGLVQGQGTGRSDSVPAMLSNGEAVINSASMSSTDNISLSGTPRQIASELNAYKGYGVRFATGGLVGQAQGNKIANASALNEANMEMIIKGINDKKVILVQQEFQASNDRYTKVTTAGQW